MSEISYVADLRNIAETSAFIDATESRTIIKAADAFEELMEITQGLAKYAVCDPLCVVFSPERRLPCNCGVNDLLEKLEFYFDWKPRGYHQRSQNG